MYQYRQRDAGQAWAELTAEHMAVVQAGPAASAFEFRTLYTAPVATGEPVAWEVTWRNGTRSRLVRSKEIPGDMAQEMADAVFSPLVYATPLPVHASEPPAAEKPEGNHAELIEWAKASGLNVPPNWHAAAEKEAQGEVNFGADVELGRLLDAHRAAKVDHSIPYGLTEHGKTRKALIRYLNAKFKAATQPAAQSAVAVPGGWQLVPKYSTIEMDTLLHGEGVRFPTRMWQALLKVAPAAQAQPVAGIGESLLRLAIGPSGTLAPGCYCKPGRCMAPRIMGRQSPCRDPAKRDAAPAQQDGQEGGEHGAR